MKSFPPRYLPSACCDGAAGRLISRAARRKKAGFSLVEVTLAMGVVAFSFVAIFGLLPTGLGIFRQAVDISVSAQVVQHVVSDVQQSDFDSLFTGLTPQNGFFALPQRYFDDQGSEAQKGASNAIYTVWVRASQPGDPDPAAAQNTNFTSLPASTGQPRFHPRDMTMLTIQIANNPAQMSLTSYGTAKANLIDASKQLIDTTAARKFGMLVQTYSVVISRNGKK